MMGLFFDNNDTPKPKGKPQLISRQPELPLERKGKPQLITPPQPELKAALDAPLPKPNRDKELAAIPYLAKRLPLIDGARGKAEFSEDGKLRFSLWREWDGTTPNLVKNTFLFKQPFVCTIGMNPSSAGADDDDKTIRNDISLIRKLGYSSFVKMNLSCLCATDPSELDKPENAYTIGHVKNEIGLICAAMDSARCIAAWGVLHGRMREYAEEITQRILHGRAGMHLWCFGVTADGSPRYTSRMAHDTPLVEWRGYP